MAVLAWLRDYGVSRGKCRYVLLYVLVVVRMLCEYKQTLNLDWVKLKSLAFTSATSTLSVLENVLRVASSDETFDTFQDINY